MHSQLSQVNHVSILEQHLANIEEDAPKLSSLYKAYTQQEPSTKFAAPPDNMYIEMTPPTNPK